MSIFKRKSLNLELINKISVLENKIDIISNNFNTDNGNILLCNCKNKENKLYNEIKEFLELKFYNFKTEILEIVKDNKDISHIIENIYLQNKTDILSILEKCKNLENIETENILNIIRKIENKIENQEKQNNIIIENQGKAIKIIENKLDIINNENENEKTKLRYDLQNFLLGLKNDILSGIKFDKVYKKLDECTQEQQNTKSEIIELKEIQKNQDNKNNAILNIINNRVDSLFYENEIIKHQFLLEEDIRNYNDEIEHIRILANNINNDISLLQSTLLNSKQK